MKLNTPNKITLIRCVLCVVCVLLLFPYQQYGLSVYHIPFAPEGVTPLIGNYTGFDPNEVYTFGFSILDLLACIVFVAASISDSIDGHLARKNHQITNFGKFMDPLADKFLVDETLIMLCFRGFSEVNGMEFGIYMPCLIVVFMIGRDLMVDGVKMLASSKGKVIAANKWGKSKTVAQMIVIPFYILNGFPFYYLIGQYTEIFMIVCMVLVLTLSWVSGIIYLYQGREVFKEN